MQEKIKVVASPCSALIAVALLHLTHANAPSAFVAASMLLTVFAAIERPPVLARLPLSVGLLLLLCPDALRRNLMAVPGAAAIALLVAVLSAMTLIASLIVALTGDSRPARWLGRFAIKSAFGSALARAEIGLAWFALAHWRPVPSDIPADAEPFGCTSTGTDVAMAWVAAGSGLVEAPILHVVLRHYSASVAWASAGLAVLTSIYLVGFAKSLALRPTLLFKDRLLLRLGVVLSESVALAEIEDVRMLGNAPLPRGHIRLFAFDGPNFAVRARGRDYLFRVDQPRRLLAKLSTV
jgi:hypothetical protein